ncbi:sugar transferase [Oenococcus oeni]|uniref:sugar transferase n=1 Tax=Oenococcus oeni TaxID=1247 RepID=UPI0010BB4F99|nr:sugar transferase [Oenococcus oeni]SYW14702.1 putative Beta-1,6-galactofuranosyltransferase WbbI [Oenococcus oeni]
MNWVTLNDEPWMPIGADKAKEDFAKIAENIGFGILKINRAEKTVDLSVIKPGDLLVHQYPSYLGDQWELNFQKELKKVGSRTVILIHDFETFRIHDYKSKKIAFQVLSTADYLITHNKKMTNRLFRINQNIFQIELFDYLSPEKNKTKKIPTSLVYAGSLSKSSWIKNYSLKIPIDIFGRLPKKWSLEKNDYLVLHKPIIPDQLPIFLNNKWGLVWDEDQEKNKTNYQNYQKINSPHKLSLYLAANIPVIVWEKSAIINFVLENKIGIAINNLAEIPDKIKKAEIDFDNLDNLSKKIRGGYFTEKLLRKIISLDGCH